MTASVDIFQVVAEPTRRRILDLLARSELPVHELAKAFHISRPAVSQHLRVLKDAGLVSERKVAQRRFYRLEAEPRREIEGWMRNFERFLASDVVTEVRS